MVWSARETHVDSVHAKYTDVLLCLLEFLRCAIIGAMYCVATLMPIWDELQVAQHLCASHTPSTSLRKPKQIYIYSKLEPWSMLDPQLLCCPALIIVRLCHTWKHRMSKRGLLQPVKRRQLEKHKSYKADKVFWRQLAGSHQLL